MLVASVCLTFVAAAQAQQVIEEVIVTGSYIKGTPEDAASPVNVLTREDMDLTGNPSIVEMLRNMGPVAGIDGESNQFQSNGLEAISNVNLRGLGAGRTLVLMNGSRMPPSPYFISQDGQQFVNTNAIPTIALERLEVLLDGASATYGSDAIAGVVNFITRKNFRGIEFQGAYKDIGDSEDPDYEAGLIIGLGTDRLSVVLSGGYQFRGEVPVREKDWALVPFSENSTPGGWTSIGNPGTYYGLGGFSEFFGADPDCETVGGDLNPGTKRCSFRYSAFDNIAEEEEHYQIFLEAEYDVSDRMTLHGEFLYAWDESSEWKTSPSYPPQALLSGDQIAVPGMPHYDDFLVRNEELNTSPCPPAGTVPCVDWSDGVLVWGRNYGSSGPSGVGPREYDLYRLNLGLVGEFGFGDQEIGYDARITYGWTEGTRSTKDTRTDHLAYAYRGLGGPDCDRTAFYADPAGSGIVPGSGDCMFYNPFTSGYQFSAQAGFEGVASPGGDNAALNNDPSLEPWLIEFIGGEPETNLLVLDLIFTGESGVSAGGGDIAWAAGVQYRRDEYKNAPFNNSNLSIEPCAFGIEPGEDFTIPDTPLLNGTGGVVPAWTYTCGGAGKFNFLAATQPFDEDQDVYAAFGELSIPFTDSLEVQIAARFEDYGGDVGSTFDPKVAARWDVTDTVTLRGSVSSAFRAPTLNQLGGEFTSLSFVGVTLAFKAVDTVGNPDLDPESAITTNLGIIWQPNENAYFSLDYWNFDFSDPIVLESFNDVVTNCLNEASAIQDLACGKITFQDPDNPTGGGVQRIKVNYQNGPDMETDGIDYKATYDFPTDFGLFTAGVQGTYVNSYQVDAWIWAGGFDAEGRLNSTTATVRPIVDLKHNTYISWSMGGHNVRLDSFYTSEYDDERAGSTVPMGTKVDDHVTFDIHYNYRFNDDNTRVFASIYNFTDEDPPGVRLDLNYDPYTHSPLGIMVKVGVTHRFVGGMFQ